MNDTSRKTVRCAIYTRVSTDAGLDQEFNSLDAQHDAAQAYIRSQAHAGWTLVRTRYDDGGFSGGSTDRPALQQLIADIKAHRVKVIVVYKVDRLTRSLADFAKLVELFDAHDVSFVSVTQQFNTTTSMGRLTLNVLLSFAQFEREVTSERIRDKIGASKRKGLWVGGMVPLGYRSKDRKITVVEHEAQTVRHIFRRYLDLGSLNLLLTDLRATGVKTRVRTLSTGRAIGGIPFTRGPLAYLLRNRFYTGEVKFKGDIFPGEQPAIIDRDLFDAVQVKLEQQRSHHTAIRQGTGAVLMGKIFDARGNRMTPTYATKNGVRYRYYVSAVLHQGEGTKAAAICRVPAAEVEVLVLTAVGKEIAASRTSAKAKDLFREPMDKDRIATMVRRVEVQSDCILVQLSGIWKPIALSKTPPSDLQGDSDDLDNKPSDLKTLTIPWKKKPSRPAREIIPATMATAQDPRPIRSETRSLLITAIAKGRLWLDELTFNATITVEHIAARETCSVRQVNRTISLAFLAPNLVRAAIDGTLPRGIGVANLHALAPIWAEQHRTLGLIA